MDEHDDDQRPAGVDPGRVEPGRTSTPTVRIIGAVPARGAVLPGGAQPGSTAVPDRPASVPANQQPDARGQESGTVPATGPAAGSASEAHAASPGGPPEVAPASSPDDAAPAAEPQVLPLLPHWTEPPTGQVPAVIDDGEPQLSGPVWREHAHEWEGLDYDHRLLASEETRLGALVSPEDTAPQPWEFDVAVEVGDVSSRLGGEDAEGQGVLALDGSSPSDPFDDDIPWPAPGGHRGGSAVSEARPLGDVAGAELDESAAGAADVRSGRRNVLRLRRTRRGLQPEARDPVGTTENGLERNENGEVASVDEVRGTGWWESSGGPAEVEEALVGIRDGATAAGRGEPDRRPLGSGFDVAPGEGSAGGRRGSRREGSERGALPGAGRRTRESGAKGSSASTGEQASTGKRAAGGGRNVPVAVGTGLLASAAAIAAMVLGPAWLLGLSALILGFCALEYFAALRAARRHPATLLGLVATVALAIGAYLRGPSAVDLVLAITIVATMLWYLVGGERGRPVDGIGATLLGVVWIGVLGSYAGLLLAPAQFPHRHGIAFLFEAITAVVMNDVGAFAVGRAVGRRPLAPRISPNKTWEGAIGGAVVGVVSSVILGAVMAPWTPGKAALVGVVAAVVAPIGDLAESLIKRDLGVKDIGFLLPGHGGFLDRFDTLLFMLPTTYYLVRLLGLG